MRIVVTGSRNWTDVALLTETLDNLHERYGITLLVHGRATGADTMAEQWAVARGVPAFSCAYAAAYGKRGGSIRNEWLLKFGKPELVVAFPTPDSVGTWNCVQQARMLNLRIRIVKEPNHASD